MADDCFRILGCLARLKLGDAACRYSGRRHTAETHAQYGWFTGAPGVVGPKADVHPFGPAPFPSFGRPISPGVRCPPVLHISGIAVSAAGAGLLALCAPALRPCSTGKRISVGLQPRSTCQLTTCLTSRACPRVICQSPHPLHHTASPSSPKGLGVGALERILLCTPALIYAYHLPTIRVPHGTRAHVPAMVWVARVANCGSVLRYRGTSTSSWPSAAPGTGGSPHLLDVAFCNPAPA